MSGLLNIATMAAHAAGKIIMQNFDRLDRVKVNIKPNQDLVTNIDLAAEQAIIDCIKKYYPNHTIISEETGLITPEVNNDPDVHWVIDPIDGTKNFINGIPHFCTSIAFKKNNETIIGIIYDPFKDETFSAIKNEGSVLNKKRIRINHKNSENIITTGLPRKNNANHTLQNDYFLKLAHNSLALRKTGSVALDLAYIGASRYNAYVDCNLKNWDKSAGLLIAKEANAYCFEFTKENDNYIIIGNENNIKFITKLFK